MGVDYSAEFDDCSNGVCRVEVNGNRISVVTASSEGVVVTATMDQWGTFYDIEGITCVAQEFGTRSFIDALIGALQHLRIHFEDTLPATIIKESE